MVRPLRVAVRSIPCAFPLCVHAPADRTQPTRVDQRHTAWKTIAKGAQARHIRPSGGHAHVAAAHAVRGIRPQYARNTRDSNAVPPAAAPSFHSTSRLPTFRPQASPLCVVARCLLRRGAAQLIAVRAQFQRAIQRSRTRSLSRCPCNSTLEFQALLFLFPRLETPPRGTHFSNYPRRLLEVVWRRLAAIGGDWRRFAD